MLNTMQSRGEAISRRIEETVPAAYFVWMMRKDWNPSSRISALISFERTLNPRITFGIKTVALNTNILMFFGDRVREQTEEQRMERWWVFRPNRFSGWPLRNKMWRNASLADGFENAGLHHFLLNDLKGAFAYRWATDHYNFDIWTAAWCNHVPCLSTPSSPSNCQRGALRQSTFNCRNSLDLCLDPPEVYELRDSFQGELVNCAILFIEVVAAFVETGVECEHWHCNLNVIQKSVHGERETHFSRDPACFREIQYQMSLVNNRTGFS